MYSSFFFFIAEHVRGRGNIFSRRACSCRLLLLRRVLELPRLPTKLQNIVTRTKLTPGLFSRGGGQGNPGGTSHLQARHGQQPRRSVGRACPFLASCGCLPGLLPRPWNVPEIESRRLLVLRRHRLHKRNAKGGVTGRMGRGGVGLPGCRKIQNEHVGLPWVSVKFTDPNNKKLLQLSPYTHPEGIFKCRLQLTTKSITSLLDRLRRGDGALHSLSQLPHRRLALCWQSTRFTPSLDEVINRLPAAPPKADFDFSQTNRVFHSLTHAAHRVFTTNTVSQFLLPPLLRPVGAHRVL